jgi:hypothetical protein
VVVVPLLAGAFLWVVWRWYELEDGMRLLSWGGAAIVISALLPWILPIAFAMFPIGILAGLVSAALHKSKAAFVALIVAVFCIVTCATMTGKLSEQRRAHREMYGD